MTGLKYRTLKKQSEKDIKLRKKLAEHSTLRTLFRGYSNTFLVSENLFALVEAIRVGNEILIREGFPVKEFIKYKLHNERE